MKSKLMNKMQKIIINAQAEVAAVPVPAVAAEAALEKTTTIITTNKKYIKILINDKWKNPQEEITDTETETERAEIRQRNLILKQKSQNYFKHRQQQQQQQKYIKYLTFIYWRACCFLQYLQTTTSTTTATKTTIIQRRKKSSLNLLPKLGASSFLTIFILLCLELILLSTVSNCAKTFYMHWNTSNSIFRIDNTDHIIDVNKGNLAFEFDQVHIICPVYEPGTYENETEKYIIYNVSKVEYETCRITNADPRVIAICDKPQKLMFFTITFRPFTPQPGGLEFLPGNDYYFISTSSKDDLYRRIGGRCSTNNMKVVFKVCCAPEENKTSTTTTTTANSSEGENNQDEININNNHHHGGHQHHINQHQTINTVNTALMPTNMAGGGVGGGSSSKMKPNVITTNVEQFNRIPMQTNPTTINGNSVNVIGNNIGDVNLGTHHLGGGILLTPGHGGINMITNGGPGNMGPYGHPGMPPGGGIRINNVPMQKNHDDHRYDKHPNEVVKNEELTYNSGCWSTRVRKPFWMEAISYLLVTLIELTTADNLLKFSLILTLLSLGYRGHEYLTIELTSKIKLNLIHYFSHNFRKSQQIPTPKTTALLKNIAQAR